MSLTVQKGFWQDTYIGNIRNKLSELCRNNPDMVTDERRILLEYWRIFDNLDAILGNRLTDFLSWWEGATLPETLSRALRSLKAEGIVPPEAEQQELEGPQFWGKGMKENNEQR